MLLWYECWESGIVVYSNLIWCFQVLVFYLWMTIEKLCVDGEWLQHRHAHRQLFCLLPWSLYYSHNHLPCFDTLLSFRIVVVMLGDLCLPFVLQLFTSNILLPCFLIFLFFSTHFSILISFPFAAHRRNEPMSRPHSWHATKFNESHSEAKTQSTPSPVWQTRYDAR